MAMITFIHACRDSSLSDVMKLEMIVYAIFLITVHSVFFGMTILSMDIRNFG